MAGNLENLLADIEIPKMALVRQKFDATKVEDIEKELRQKLEEKGVRDTIKKGSRIALTAGSRGVANIVKILKVTADFIKECGGVPFVVPAMGSHGGATAEGQADVLKGLGITEETVGCPILSTMETVIIGKTKNNYDVHFDKYAYEADGVVVIGRIKIHTSFRGKYESGLAKMITIGLGKQKGAEFCHKEAMSKIPKKVEEIATYVLKNANVIFGIGTVENAFDETAVIEVLRSNEIMEKEPKLLEISWSKVARIYADSIDVLVVDEIGKDISGTGMDTNIIKRYTYMPSEKYIQRIALLGLTAKTLGNGNGIGFADVCCQRLEKQFNREKTYPNPMTSRTPTAVRMPMVMENDLITIKTAIKTCLDVDYSKIRMVRIKNTLELSEILVSEGLLKEMLENNNVELIRAPEYMAFDENGNLF